MTSKETDKRPSILLFLTIGVIVCLIILFVFFNTNIQVFVSQVESTFLEFSFIISAHSDSIIELVLLPKILKSLATPIISLKALL